MLDKQTILSIRQEIAPHDPPVLSLYVNVNPAETGNQQKAHVKRARVALEALEMPDALRKEVLRKLDQELVIPAGRSLVLFAGEDTKKLFTVQYLHGEIPLLNLRSSDGALARYGTPYVAPLLFAIDQAERYAAIYVSRDYARVFEVFLGEIRENWSSVRDTDTEEWTRTTEARHAPGMGNPVTARGGRDVDRFAARTEVDTARFYKELVSDFTSDTLSTDADRIIVLGTPDARKGFMSALPKALQDRVVAQLAPPGDDSKSAAAWYPLLADAIKQAEDAGEEALLAQIRERGSVGMSEVLNLMNAGQIHVLALPFTTDPNIWISSETRTVGASREALVTQRPGEEYEEVRLTDVLSELVTKHNFKVEFMDDEQADKLQNDFAGIAALRRW